MLTNLKCLGLCPEPKHNSTSGILGKARTIGILFLAMIYINPQ